MRKTLVVVILAGALVLAGCGSTDTGVGDDDGGTRTANEQETQLAYENGYQQCTGFSLKDLQQTYNAEEATKESVGEAVARSNPGQPELHPATKQGCIDAIDGKPLDQSGGFDPEGDTNTVEE
jgi:predicted small secreted protein